MRTGDQALAGLVNPGAQQVARGRQLSQPGAGYSTGRTRIERQTTAGDQAQQVARDSCSPVTTGARHSTVRPRLDQRHTSGHSCPFKT